ncbi:hypothetical protein SDC9_136642 [bioreactor metagenome]|uniref:Uncharacterized protein n=1 Tax=bioreactor metagenome TaxID=1076179 RepID=A0A645DL53_9ZZZZ
MFVSAGVSVVCHWQASIACLASATVEATSNPNPGVPSTYCGLGFPLLEKSIVTLASTGGLLEVWLIASMRVASAASSMLIFVE